MQTTSLHDDDLLTPAEAAELAGCSIETIRERYRDGSLRAYQPSPRGRVRIPKSELFAWLGRPAARNASPLEDADWAEPAPGVDPRNGMLICDESTLFLRVHTSRFAEFYDAKIRAGR